MDTADAQALLDEHAADDCFDITTIGRRSGRPHRIEIWFGVVDGEAFLISGNGPKADWFRNALVSGSATVHLAGHDVPVGASEVTDPELRRRVGDLMGAKYQWDGDPSIGLTRHAWCYDVPLLRLTPT